MVGDAEVAEGLGFVFGGLGGGEEFFEEGDGELVAIGLEVGDAEVAEAIGGFGGGAGGEGEEEEGEGGVKEGFHG